MDIGPTRNREGLKYAEELSQGFPKGSLFHLSNQDNNRANKTEGSSKPHTHSDHQITVYGMYGAFHIVFHTNYSNCYRLVKRICQRQLQAQ
jgi:hypothetical protein